MTIDDDILTENVDSVATIILNRPHRKNAITMRHFDRLATIVEHLREDHAVRVIVLTGAGTAFCAGGDVMDFARNGGEGGGGGGGGIDAAAVAHQQTQQRRIIAGLRTMRKPVIAALPGAAAGAGIGLALAADLRIGTSRTVFATSFVGVGLSGDFGTSWQLQELLGRARTTELMLLGNRIGAEEALRLGLLNQVVPAEDLAERTHSIAAALARGPQEAIRAIKANIVTAERFSLVESMDAEVERHKLCGTTDDHRAAVAAFERRPRSRRT